MGLIIGGVPPHDLILDGHSVSLYVGGTPPTKVWPTREVVQITLGDGYMARDQFRAALTDRGLDYKTITEVPFDIELVRGVGNAQHLFYGCSALRSIPPLDTRNVWNMNGIFQMCSSLVDIPPLDTRNVWNAPSMFAYCSSLTSVPTMDTSKMTNVSYMYTGCTSLTSVPAMDTSSVTNMSAMFRSCTRLTQVPAMNTSNVTNMNHMFYNCAALTDGNVLLIGRHPQVNTENMIDGSGLTREPWDIVIPRKVTINGSASGWNQATATGDTGLIQEWFGGNRVRFHTPIKCNQQVYNGTSGLVVVSAGKTIPAGAPVQPITYNGPYIFTEVL